jgi:hypothetical protein
MQTFNSIFGYSKGELLQIRIQALNANGGGEFSDELVNGLVYKDTPDVVTGLSAVSTALDSVELSWTELIPSVVNQEPAIINYRLYAKVKDNPSDELSTTEFQITASSSPATINGLTSGSTYSFSIAAVNSYGEGPKQQEVSVLVAWVPPQPDPVEITESGENVILTWEPPLLNNGAEILEYSVEILTPSASNGNGVTENAGLFIRNPSI